MDNILRIRLAAVFAAGLLWTTGTVRADALATTANLELNLSSGAVAAACRDSKAKAEERFKALGTVASPDFAGTFVAFSDALSDLADETAIPMFLGQVSTDKGVRDAGIACDTDINQYLVEVFTREDLYKPLMAAATRREMLEGEDARLVEKTLLDFKRSGLGLPPAEREKLKGIRQKVVAVANDFQKEVSETKDYALFTKAQLEGVPEDMVKRLDKGGDNYKVTLDYPDYFPFMENAKDPEARKVLEAKFNNRGGMKNKTRLAEVLQLRDEAAKLLGYKNHAEYVLEDRMAGRPDAVFAFLGRLRDKLKVKGERDLRTLRELKGEEERKSDGILHAWDWRYYHIKLLKTRYQVDKEKIREYFPTELVIGEMLKIYQELLGLRFKEVAPAEVWHPDVKLYEVSDSKTGVPLARFFLDLYPREGKYKHAAAFTLIQGRRLPDGSYQMPSAAMVANFDKPTPDKPSLIPHAEVETLFHEFGHIMHQVLTHAKYQRFSGTSVARDFVEAPSQIFENWVWKEDILKRLSSHYKDKKPLPKETIEKMIAAKLVDSGLIYLRQNFFGIYDMTLHTQPVPDTTALYAKLMKEVSLIPMSQGTMPEASFTHLMGYDAGYYSYLWAEVFAQDMFSRFEKEGLTNETLGREYRKWILEPGGSREESESLKGFLGREPSDEPFLKSIGLYGIPVK